MRDSNSKMLQKLYSLKKQLRKHAHGEANGTKPKEPSSSKVQAAQALQTRSPEAREGQEPRPQSQGNRSLGTRSLGARRLDFSLGGQEPRPQEPRRHEPCYLTDNQCQC